MMSSTITRRLRRFLDRWLHARRPQGVLEASLAEMLERSHAERDLRAWLRRHDYLVGIAFGRSASPRGMLTDFGGGTPWACDFVVLGCAPGWWDATFVHLDSPKARQRQQNGHATRAHGSACEHLAAWRDVVAGSGSALRARLAQAVAPLRLPPSVPQAALDAAAEIRRPDCAVSFQSCVVLGRRERAAGRPRRRHRQAESPSAFWIATYDELLEAARRFDTADELQRQSHLFWKG